MCDHCGCRGVQPIAALMDEHLELLEQAGEARRRLADGDRPGAALAVAALSDALAPHVWEEEQGLFAAMRQQGDFVAHVDELERDHGDIDTALARLDPADADWPGRVTRLLDLLEEHIGKENLGLFPVAVVSLGAQGWEQVTAAAATRRARARVSRTTGRWSREVGSASTAAHR